jgi:hypothetical protein
LRRESSAEAFAGFRLASQASICAELLSETAAKRGSLIVEAVAQTPREPVTSLLRVGSEKGHLVRRARAIRGEVVADGSSGVYFREPAAAVQSRLYATASTTNGSGLLGGSNTAASVAAANRARPRLGTDPGCAR